jgi:tetratricopeptide (TPR) repeat protein
MNRYLGWPALVVASLCLGPGVTHAQDKDVEESSPARAPEALPPLPVPPKLELPKPTAEDLADVDARLADLTSDQAEQRDAAARELLEVKARLVPAIAHRLDGIADRADKEAMKRLFSDVRENARDRVRDEQRQSGRTSKVETPDYLAMLIHEKPPKDAKAYGDLVRVVGLSRMLTQIGTVEAVRVLVEVYVRFGEFLRIHTQRELGTLGDRAVAALIEARRHPAEKIGSWARRQLDALGRAVPSEAVQIPDPAALADVLRAYGRVKDPDAARIVASFANSERAVIRDAARQAIVLFGEVGTWQLRDSYENTVGKRPPRDWSWERMARELFAELDRMRSGAISKIYEAGRVAEAKGDYETMRKAFDDVLAADPRFERRAELAKAYRAYAERALESDPARAEEALFRALRLSDDADDQRRIESLLITVQAGAKVKRGVLDRTVLARALELDPRNARAKKLLEEFSRGAPDHSSERARKLAASTVVLGALAALFVLFRRRSEKAPSSPPGPSEVPPGESATNGSPQKD